MIGANLESREYLCRRDGASAARAVARAILMGWEKSRDLSAAREWADHLVPEGVPSTAWRDAYKATLQAQGV